MVEQIEIKGQLLEVFARLIMTFCEMYPSSCDWDMKEDFIIKIYYSIYLQSIYCLLQGN